MKPAKNGKMTPLAAGKAVITIKASGNEEYKAKTIKVKAKVFPKKPAQVKKEKAVPSKAKRTAKVTWKKTSASGYQIQYAYSKKVSKGKMIKAPKGKSVSKTIKKLKSRKYMYVRVRAYTAKAGLTSYGKWSKTARSRKKIR